MALIFQMELIIVHRIGEAAPSHSVVIYMCSGGGRPRRRRGVRRKSQIQYSGEYPIVTAVANLHSTGTGSGQVQGTGMSQVPVHVWDQCEYFCTIY